MQDTTQTPKNSSQSQVKFFTWEYAIPVKNDEETKQKEDPKVQTTEQPVHVVELIIETAEHNVYDTPILHTNTEENITAQVVTTSIDIPVIENINTPQAENIAFDKSAYNVPLDWETQNPVINVSNRRYTAGSYGKLAVIFNDRKKMYYLFSALFLISSTIVATLIFKLAEIGNDNPFSYITKYDLFSKTLPKSFFGAFLLSAPILISSLFIFFGGFTIFSKFLSSVWMITFGAFWSIFSVYVFDSFGVLQKIIFTVLSAALALSCIIFSAEAGKYSNLNYYGKNELLKFSNVKNYSILYLFFCSMTCFIIYLYLKFAVIQ